MIPGIDFEAVGRVNLGRLKRSLTLHSERVGEGMSGW